MNSVKILLPSIKLNYNVDLDNFSNSKLSKYYLLFKGPLIFHCISLENISLDKISTIADLKNPPHKMNPSLINVSLIASL